MDHDVAWGNLVTSTLRAPNCVAYAWRGKGAPDDTYGVKRMAFTLISETVWKLRGRNWKAWSRQEEKASQRSRFALGWKCQEFGIPLAKAAKSWGTWKGDGKKEVLECLFSLRATAHFWAAAAPHCFPCQKSSDILKGHVHLSLASLRLGWPNVSPTSLTLCMTYYGVLSSDLSPADDPLSSLKMDRVSDLPWQVREVWDWIVAFRWCCKSLIQLQDHGEFDQEGIEQIQLIKTKRSIALEIQPLSCWAVSSWNLGGSSWKHCGSLAKQANWCRIKSMLKKNWRQWTLPKRKVLLQNGESNQCERQEKQVWQEGQKSEGNGKKQPFSETKAIRELWGWKKLHGWCLFVRTRISNSGLCLLGVLLKRWKPGVCWILVAWRLVWMILFDTDTHCAWMNDVPSCWCFIKYSCFCWMPSTCYSCHACQ